MSDSIYYHVFYNILYITARGCPGHAGQAGRSCACPGRPDPAAPRGRQHRRAAGTGQHGGRSAGAVCEARLPHAHIRPGGGGRPATPEELHHHVLRRQDEGERGGRQQEGRKEGGGSEDDRQGHPLGLPLPPCLSKFPITVEEHGTQWRSSYSH